jgi:hypothetical protein
MTTTAHTILSQLGGNKFLAMTGAQCVTGPDALHIQLPRVAQGINRIVVTLEPTDTYTVSFAKFNRSKLEVLPVTSHTGVYADQLQALFTEQTGLLTHL